MVLIANVFPIRQSWMFNTVVQEAGDQRKRRRARAGCRCSSPCRFDVAM